ncbi:MAG: hypothetical protein LBV73_31035, partial [Paraburkholderia sp.]|nr:hypothetical protein [Paraburkholderia sp.]
MQTPRKDMRGACQKSVARRAAVLPRCTGPLHRPEKLAGEAGSRIQPQSSGRPAGSRISGKASSET